MSLRSLYLYSIHLRLVVLIIFRIVTGYGDDRVILEFFSILIILIFIVLTIVVFISNVKDLGLELLRCRRRWRWRSGCCRMQSTREEVATAALVRW